MLEGSFVINMTPFFKHSEPHDSATTIRLSNEHDHFRYTDRSITLFIFPICKDGKRLYSDNGVDSFIYNQEDGYSYQINHVTHIEVI